MKLGLLAVLLLGALTFISTAYACPIGYAQVRPAVGGRWAPLRQQRARPSLDLRLSDKHLDCAPRHEQRALVSHSRHPPRWHCMAPSTWQLQIDEKRDRLSEARRYA
jgi:hypothetical protein